MARFKSIKFIDLKVTPCGCGGDSLAVTASDNEAGLLRVRGWAHPPKIPNE